MFERESVHDGRVVNRRSERPSPWQLLFAVAGALALGVQTYVLREFLILVQGDEVALGLGLGAWFIGICGGAAVARIVSDRGAGRLAITALTLLGTLGCGLMWCARIGRGLFGVAFGEFLSLAQELLFAFGLFMPLGACVGAAFVALAKTYAQSACSTSLAIGRLYVFESIGSLVAGLIISQLFLFAIEPSRGVLVVFGICAAGCLPAARARLIPGRRLIPCIVGVSVTMGLTPFADWIEHTTERVRFRAISATDSLAEALHTPYQHIAIGGGDPRVLYANGQYVTSFPDPAANELLAHQLMLLTDAPNDVLGFGNLETGLLKYCLLHPVKRFDLVVLDSDAFRFLQRHLDPESRSALMDPRVHVIFDEPRRYLARTQQQYDLVLNYSPDPSTLLLARTSSLEFARLVQQRLRASGTYVTRFSAGANLQSGEVGQFGASLFKTLREVFPLVLATPGPEAFFVCGASGSSASVDPLELAARYVKRGVTSNLFDPILLEELMPPERVATQRSELEAWARSTEVARDDRPVTFLHALGVRQRVAGSGWALLLAWAARHPRWVFALMLAPSLLLLLLHWTSRSLMTKRGATLHATAVTGACGLAASLIVFTSFQTRVGALYSELGALSGLFMVGLGFGGFLSTRGEQRYSLFRAQSVGLFGNLFLLLVLGLLDRIQCGRVLQWILHVLLLLVAGFGTGLVFPAASRNVSSPLPTHSSTHTGDVAASLEFWDHAGAALAALLAAILLIPCLGMLRSAGLLVVLQAVAILFVASSKPTPPESGVRSCHTCRP